MTLEPSYITTSKLWGYLHKHSSVKLTLFSSHIWESNCCFLCFLFFCSSPKIKISPYKTIIGESVASKVGASSGRGPSSFSPAILKVLFHSSLFPEYKIWVILRKLFFSFLRVLQPDIAAPGVTLVTSKIPTDQDTSEFAYSGTSMATPVIAGIVALLKISHPDWSPAAIKSALVTTGLVYMSL